MKTFYGISTTINTSKWYTQRGMSVIPLSPEKKSPLLSHFNPYCYQTHYITDNFGVLTGKTVKGNLSLVVFDFDEMNEETKKSAKEITEKHETHIVHTKRGLHIYFLVDQIYKNKSNKKIELKANGCQVLSGGSKIKKDETEFKYISNGAEIKYLNEKEFEEVCKLAGIIPELENENSKAILWSKVPERAVKLLNNPSANKDRSQKESEIISSLNFVGMNEEQIKIILDSSIYARKFESYKVDDKLISLPKYKARKEAIKNTIESFTQVHKDELAKRKALVEDNKDYFLSLIDNFPSKREFSKRYYRRVLDSILGHFILYGTIKENGFFVSITHNQIIAYSGISTPVPFFKKFKFIHKVHGGKDGETSVYSIHFKYTDLRKAEITEDDFEEANYYIHTAYRKSRAEKLGKGSDLFYEIKKYMNEDFTNKQLYTKVTENGIKTSICSITHLTGILYKEGVLESVRKDKWSRIYRLNKSNEEIAVKRNTTHLLTKTLIINKAKTLLQRLHYYKSDRYSILSKLKSFLFLLFSLPTVVKANQTTKQVLIWIKSLKFTLRETEFCIVS